MSQSQDDKKPFDPFELTAAILLGLGAIAASVAGHQNNLWGGQSVQAFSASTAMTSSAASTFNFEQSTYDNDVAIERRVKELIWESREVKDEDHANRNAGMASWILISQLSPTAYKYLGMPEEVRKAYWDGDQAAALTPEQLQAASINELHSDYVDELFAPSAAEFAEAEKRFEEGSDADAKGDEFSLAVVVFTVSLFFAGLSLVFKTKLRWGFLGLGAAVLAAGMGFMSTLTWA